MSSRKNPGFPFGTAVAPAIATIVRQTNFAVSKIRRRKEVICMRKLAIAFAIVFSLNMISSIISLATPISYADDDPQPEPKKPDSE
jgi:hypothetical protein